MLMHQVWRTIATTALWKLFENKEVMEVGETHSRTLSPLISPSLFNEVPAGLPTPPAFCTRSQDHKASDSAGMEESALLLPF